MTICHVIINGEISLIDLAIVLAKRKTIIAVIFAATLALGVTILRNTREILPPIRSIDPTGGSRKIIVVISAITGLFLGIFAAFFTEFLSKVKQKIAMDEV